MRIRDGKIRIRDGKKSDPGCLSRIRNTGSRKQFLPISFQIQLFELFSPKTEGTKTNAARVLIRWLPRKFGRLYLPT
jgi:hypothetical protein